MIIYIRILLKDIFKLGRKYPWPRPRCCPRCGHRKVWGHGYTDLLFDGYKKALQLKRYRCPCCGCVMRYRPDSHFSRFQSSIQKIRSIVAERVSAGRWPPGESRQRSGHWLRSLKRNAFSMFGFYRGKDFIKIFDYLMSLGVNPVSRSI